MIPAQALTKRDCEFVFIPKTDGAVRWDHAVTNMPCAEQTQNWKYVPKRENSGPALGVIQTESHNQRNPNAPTFEDRSFESTLSLEEKGRTEAWNLLTRTCRKLQVRILRIEICSSNTVPLAIFLHLLYLRRKRETSLWTRELRFIGDRKVV